MLSFQKESDIGIRVNLDRFLAVAHHNHLLATLEPHLVIDHPKGRGLAQADHRHILVDSKVFVDTVLARLATMLDHLVAVRASPGGLGSLAQPQRRGTSP